MERIYCPWRKEYVHKVYDNRDKRVEEQCVFCSHQKDDDEKHFILKRGKHNFVLLNLYPYNTGHLLIIPYEHTADLNELSQEARAELMELTNQATHIIKNELGAHGVNIGLNLGKASGAGIPDHLHLHVLPRWFGDTNFLPTLANTKQVSTDLREMYQTLKKNF
jgi:ATP adenylyltransferase